MLRSLAVVRVPHASRIQALAVAYSGGKTVLAWGTSRGLYLRRAGITSLVVSGAVSNVRFTRVGSQLSLVAAVDARLIRVDSPRWNVHRTVGRADGRILSVEDGRELAMLWSDGNRLELAVGSRRPQTLATHGSGVLGWLDGRLAVAYAGLMGGKYSVQVATIATGRLRSKVVEENVPCARPVALGSDGSEPKIFLASRCGQSETAKIIPHPCRR